MVNTIKETEYVLLPVPTEIMTEANLKESDNLQFSVNNGKIEIEAVRDIEGLICNGDCRNCPCSDDCDECE